MSEAQVIRVLRQLVMLNIFTKSQRKSDSDLKALIAQGNYIFYDADETTKEIKIKITDNPHLSDCFTNECNRMGIAAIESISGLKNAETIVKSTAWKAIRLYYSAFFSAHSLLRMFGWACCQLESDHVRQFNQLLNLSMSKGSKVTKLEKGFYLIKRENLTSDIISLKKLTDSHADTWKSFRDLLRELQENIPKKTTSNDDEKTKTIIFLNFICEGLESNTRIEKANWLSFIRNSINYQHSHDIWFPYRDKIYKTYLDQHNMDWIKSVGNFELRKDKSEIVYFTQICLIISTLFRELFTHCCSLQRGNLNNKFDNQLMKIIRQIHI